MPSFRQHHPLVITPEEVWPNEARALFALIENGAEIIHLRKPGLPEHALRDYLTGLHPEILYHLTLHHHADLAGYFGLGGVHERQQALERIGGSFRKSASCHDWGEVKACTGRAIIADPAARFSCLFQHDTLIECPSDFRKQTAIPRRDSVQDACHKLF